MFFGCGAELWSAPLSTLEFKRHGTALVGGEVLDFGARGDGRAFVLIKPGDTLTLLSVDTDCLWEENRQAGIHKAIR